MQPAAELLPPETDSPEWFHKLNGLDNGQQDFFRKLLGLDTLQVGIAYRYYEQQLIPGLILYLGLRSAHGVRYRRGL